MIVLMMAMMMMMMQCGLGPEGQLENVRKNYAPRSCPQHTFWFRRWRAAALQILHFQIEKRQPEAKNRCT